MRWVICGLPSCTRAFPCSVTVIVKSKWSPMNMQVHTRLQVIEFSLCKQDANKPSGNTLTFRFVSQTGFLLCECFLQAYSVSLSGLQHTQILVSTHFCTEFTHIRIHNHTYSQADRNVHTETNALHLNLYTVIQICLSQVLSILMSFFY